MKISVVIPVYNAEAFIKKSYNSIMHQSLTDFEIIYVDNNSADQSLQELKKIENQDHRVRVLQQTKQGAAPARNLGLQAAQGDYVYLFDVDDEIYPDALNTMIKVLDDYPKTDAVFGRMVKSKKSIPETIKPDDESLKVIFKDKPYWGIQWFRDLSTVVGPPAFLYRKKTIEALGYYNEDLKIAEDTALDIKLGMTCNVAFLDMYVYLYYKHESSILESSKKDQDQIFNLWQRLSKAHLPFYFKNDTPLEFNTILFKQLFSTMGKIVSRTKGFSNRWRKLKTINAEVAPMQLPLTLKMWLMLLAIIPNKNLLKVYVYHVSHRYVSDAYLHGSIKKDLK